ncbi:MAG: DHH family phosphoesterase [Clostridia bacterium]|nr:DHH family phosphoesterase [Clostridia bacterium]
MTRSETCAILREKDNFVILTHRRPDGDTIGSAASLCRALRALGKTAFVLENEQFTPRFAPFLEGLLCNDLPKNAFAVAVDIASEPLLSFDAVRLGLLPALSIDHHGGNSLPCEKLVEADKAACGEIIFALIRELGVPLEKQMAEALYVALSTDTGCFKYANVTANTLRTAAELVEAGAAIAPINRLFFDTRSPARLKLEARLTESMEFYANGLVGLCVLPKSWLEELSVCEDDIDSISGFARSVEGVEIGIMIREVENNTGKISVRTGLGYSAADFCAKLGGGGHAGAAGASVPGGIECAKREILRVLRESGLEL